MRVTRRLWVAAAVWVAFWSLYPTFSRPRAFHAAIQSGARELGACDPILADKARQECWAVAGGRMQQRFDAITLRSEYEGYAGVWFGVGLCVPAAAVLAWMLMSKRRMLA